VTFLAFLIRLAWLGRKSIWLDEVYSLGLASREVTQIIEYITHGDSTPPLYFLMLHYILPLGQTEFILRLPSAIFGALSVGACYSLGRVWAGKWTGIAGAAFLAIAPIHVWYSQEARAYILAGALGLFSVLALSHAVISGRWFAWLGWIGATVLGLHTHYMFLIIFLVEVIVLWPACHRYGVLKGILGAVLSLVAIVLLCTPWFLSLVRVFDQAVNSIIWYFEPVSTTLATLSIVVTKRQLFDVSLLILLFTLVILSLLGWYTVIWWWRKAFPVNKAMMVSIIIFYLALLVFSAWPRGYSIRRQIAIFIPYFLLAIAWVFSNLRERNKLLIGLGSITIPLLFFQLAIVEWQDWRSVAQFMNGQVSSQDVVLFSAPWNDTTLDYYYHDSVDRFGVTPADIPVTLSRLTLGKARVWLILSGDVLSDPNGAIPVWLVSQRARLAEYGFPGIQVWLYGASP